MTSRLSLAVYGALVFLIIFGLRYAMIDDDLYTARDDGIITMSVGRNLIDYGFIGVNPSGPIVEASSSPLQTLVYAGAYALTGLDFFSFSEWQTYVTAAILGGIFALFFVDVPRCQAGITIFSSAALLTFFYPFFLWHGSGMENALSHVFLLASIYGVFTMARAGRISVYWIPVFALATLPRIDSVLQIAVLLFAFSIWWRIRMGTYGAFWISVATGIVWGCVQAARFAYFGDIFPNTAHAQEISVGNRITGLLSLDGAVLYDSLYVWAAIVVKQGWWVVFPAVLLFRWSRLNRPMRAAMVCLIVLGIATILTPALFGRARIDTPRTTTQITPLVVLASAIVLTHTEHLCRSVVAACSILLLTMVFFRGPYYLGWHTGEMIAIRTELETLGRENDLHRPLISNPDLGAMSWKKSLNVLDIGRLGSPVLAQLQDPNARAEYILGFAQPDIISLRGPWAHELCSALYRDRRFDRIYVDLSGEVTGQNYDCERPRPRLVYWFRRDIMKGSSSVERALVDKLSMDLSVSSFEDVLEDCNNVGDILCMPAVRTAYRFLPELREAGLADQVISLFPDPRARAYLSGWFDPASIDTLVLETLKDTQ